MLQQQTDLAFSDVVEETVRDPQIGELVSALSGQDYSGQEKTMRLTFMKPSMEPLVVTLSVDASPGCGGIVWPAGQVLSNYLVRRDRSFFQDKTILELGSGTGLVGIVAAKLGANVWVTDQAPLLDIMRQNVLRNNLSSRCTVAELNWGDPIPADIPAPDVVLAADCVYFEPVFPLLVQTLCDIYEKKPEILFCYKKRRKADKRFFAMLKKKFTWEQVMDDPDREIYNRDSVTLVRLYRLK
ncbi:putative methyltransferase-domain-containing protein [Desarmillaria tabescens]|uniref:Protein-lysine N-methyltransferase EFM6 n=1 Tax=Armillaria tabescens TaxID=1929756 RepID=A0AA39TVY7_ARMTA|nr:putative methyltransferase-domain-containing protein [Desarmillaria tabescens]KAK0468013.1 putative methyltransferase-domain-containing protein [Desarmillaria tabescens]